MNWALPPGAVPAGGDPASATAAAAMVPVAAAAGPTTVGVTGVATNKAGPNAVSHSIFWMTALKGDAFLKYSFVSGK